MTGYESKRAAAQDKLKCQCSLSTSLTGDGCQYCNPEYMDDDALTIAYQSGFYDGKKAAQPAQEPVAKYCCHVCFDKSSQTFLDRMILCSECGNKRCPKATNHALPCTNSNNPLQPAQEPVAWSVVGNGKFGEYELGQVFVDYEATHTYWENRGYELVPVYTTPPQRPWVGLTAEEAAECWTTSATQTWKNFENALRNKNT